MSDDEKNNPPKPPFLFQQTALANLISQLKAQSFLSTLNSNQAKRINALTTGLGNITIPDAGLTRDQFRPLLRSNVDVFRHRVMHVLRGKEPFEKAFRFGGEMDHADELS